VLGQATAAHANKVVDRMRRAGLRPDAQTHNLVLEAVAKAARSGKAPPPLYRSPY